MGCVRVCVSGCLEKCEAKRMRWIKEDVHALSSRSVSTLLLGNTCRHALNKALYPLLPPPTLTPAPTLCPSAHHPHPSPLLSPPFPSSNQWPLCPFLLELPWFSFAFSSGCSGLTRQKRQNKSDCDKINPNYAQINHSAARMLYTSCFINPQHCG